MRYVIILFGTYLIINALVYFIKLSELLSNSYEFTNYGFGILAGKLIFLFMGITLMFFGIKRIRAKKGIKE